MSEEGESWQSEHQFFTDNPDAAKATAKYKTENDYHKGAYEAMTKVGRPYWLPDDHSKLTDEQKADIRANVAKMNGVPETADGYTINIPPDTKSPIDAEAIAGWKIFCKENNLPPELAQKCVDFQVAMIEKVNNLQEEARKERARENFKALSKSLNGDTNAIVAMQQIKEYLQSFCKDKEGNPDSNMWEEFMVRMFFEDKIVENVLAQALLTPARLHSEGGAPGDTLEGKVAPGVFDYPEMKK